MDDIDDYYTERSPYPQTPMSARGSPQGARSYPPPRMMRNGPPPMIRAPMGRPPPQGYPGGPRMSPPRGRQMGPPMGAPMGHPMGHPMGRPMNPYYMGPPPTGPPRMPPPPRPDARDRSMSPGGAMRGPPPHAGPGPVSPYAHGPRFDSFDNNMMPAPLKMRRTPPPQDNGFGPPPRRQDVPLNIQTPPLRIALDMLGARKRSVSPMPLDSIGAPRGGLSPRRTQSPTTIGRSASAPRSPMAPTGDYAFLEPQWNAPARHRAYSADDRSPISPPIVPPAPLNPIARQPSPVFRPAPFQADREANGSRPAGVGIKMPPVGEPGMLSPRQHGSRDIVLSSDFIEEITVGPYQNLDRPPPPPRKDSYQLSPKPSLTQQIMSPRMPKDPARSVYQSKPDGLPPTPDEEDPLPTSRGLRSMYLGDIQAGPYGSSEDAPPLPSKSLMPQADRSPMINTPHLSDCLSDDDGDEWQGNGITSVSNIMAGLRINTKGGDDDGWEDDLLSTTTYSAAKPLPSAPFGAGSSGHSSLGSNSTLSVDFKLEDNEHLTEIEGGLPMKQPRKHVPSMHEYMSLDQLESLWDKEDRFGGGFYGAFETMPVLLEEEDSRGKPF